MSPAPFTIPGHLDEEAWPTTVARVTHANNSLILNADVVTGVAGTAGTGVDIYVYDSPSSTPTTAVWSSLGNASSGFLYDTLQTDGYWEGEDENGYNFRHTLDVTEAGLIANGGHQYRIEYRINKSSGGPAFVKGQYVWGGMLHT